MDLLPVNSNMFKGGSLASTANTADQTIVTYTVPDGKTLYLTVLGLNARLTTYAATATSFGAASVTLNGTKIMTFSVLAGPGQMANPIHFEFPVPMPFQAGDILAIVCTPSAATAFTWGANFAGFLK